MVTADVWPCFGQYVTDQHTRWSVWQWRRGPALTTIRALNISPPFVTSPRRRTDKWRERKRKKKETKTKGHIYATELYSKNKHHKSLDFEKKAELIRRFCFFSSYPVPVQSSRLETKALFALSWSIVMVTLVLFAEWKGKSWYRAASQVDGTTMNWACRFSAFPCPENAAILLDEPYIPENNSVAER